MSYRELLQLAIDQSSWMSQAGDQGIADGRLRTHRNRRHQRVDPEEDHENVPDMGRRRGWVPPRRRLQHTETPVTSGHRVNEGTELRTTGESQLRSYPPTSTPETLEEPTPGSSTSELPILQPSTEGSRSPQQTSERLVEPTPSTSQVLLNLQPTTQATNNRPVRGRHQRGRRARQIQGLPSRTFTGNEDLKSCTICVDDYVIGEEVTILPCSHIFHLPCIAHWIWTNPRCPLCRLPSFYRKRRT